MHKTDRRAFLSLACGAAAAGVGAPTAWAIDPIKRSGKPIFKLSLAAYSMRKYLTAKPETSGAMDLAGFIDFCAKLGLDGAELTSYYFPKSMENAFLQQIKRQTHIAGLTISGGAIGNDYCVPTGPKLEAQISETKRWIDIYATLGAPVIRVFAGSVPKGEQEDVAVTRCIAALEQVCDEAGKRGILLGLENHGGVTATADQLLRIVQAVKSPWFGVNFDSGNFRDNADPYAEMARIAPYAVNAQIKVEVYRRRKAEPADLSRIVDILRQSAYRGWLALEYESSEDPYDAIPRHIDALRKVLES